MSSLKSVVFQGGNPLRNCLGDGLIAALNVSQDLFFFCSQDLMFTLDVFALW